MVETKVCPLCAETIKAAARTCPFCRSRQSRLWLWTYELASVLVALVYVGLGIYIFVLLNPNAGDGRSFAGHRDELRVLNATISRTEADSRSWLSGFITNQGSYPWRVQELEVRLLDQQTQLAEVVHRTVKDQFVVLPRRDHAFHISLGGGVPTNIVLTLQVRVQVASDGNLPMKPD